MKKGVVFRQISIPDLYSKKWTPCGPEIHRAIQSVLSNKSKSQGLSCHAVSVSEPFAKVIYTTVMQHE